MRTDRALAWAAAVYAIIVLLKLGVWLATGLLVFLAEALHSLTDLVVSGFLALSYRWSRKPADTGHPFGHGRAENVAGLIAATLFISMTSYGILVEAVPRLWSVDAAPGEVGSLPWIVLVASMLLLGIPWFLLRSVGPGAASKAQKTELFNDGVGLGAAALGTWFAARGIGRADAVASIVVALVVAVAAVRLLRENADFLLGKAPGATLLQTVQKVAASVPGVLSVSKVRAERVGPMNVHLGIRIHVEAAATVLDASRVAQEVERRVHALFPGESCAVEIAPPEATIS